LTGSLPLAGARFVQRARARRTDNAELCVPSLAFGLTLGGSVGFRRHRRT
jgi:hypothetical protein